MTNVHKVTFKNQLDHIDAQVINQRYEAESQMMAAVTLGNFEMYMQLAHQPRDFDVRVRRLQNDHLRDRQNAMVIRKILMRISARNGGVPPVYLHILTEKYAIMIDQSVSPEYIDNILADEMAKAFCDAVSQFSIKNYSELIQEAILYIDSHITNALSVRIVANAIGSHPTYLSRRFKQESNENITDYISKQRIQYAIHQFQAGDLDITNVGLNCGFSSSSYFSKVFKKFMQVSPSQYIKEKI